MCGFELTLLPRSSPEEPSWLRPQAFAFCFAVFGSVSAMMPIMRKQLGLTPMQVSVAIALPILLGSLGRIPLGILTDRFGGRIVFSVVMSVSIIPSAMIGDAEHVHAGADLRLSHWTGARELLGGSRVRQRMVFGQPGPYYEKHDRLNVFLPYVADPLSDGTGLNLLGRMALANTPMHPRRTVQELHWRLFAPRLGFAFRATSTTTVRGGYGLSYLPNDVGFSSGPQGAPVNYASTQMTTSLNGGLTPHNTLSNPFLNGIFQPIGNDVSRLGNWKEDFSR